MKSSINSIGGGKPMLYLRFVRQFRKECSNKWKITTETSQTCPEDVILDMFIFTDKCIADLRDIFEEIYERDTEQRKGIFNDLGRIVGCCPYLLTLINRPVVVDDLEGLQFEGIEFGPSQTDTVIPEYILYKLHIEKEDFQ